MNKQALLSALLVAACVAFVSLSSGALADDNAYLSHVRRQAEAQVRDTPWLMKVGNYIMGCDDACQIEERVEEIVNQPVGSIGIRG